MAIRVAPLTDAECRNARKKRKPYRLHDGAGLALYVAPSGAKSWQLRYRSRDGREQTATLGKLEAVTLAQAREAAKEARKRAADGEQLTAVKRQHKEAAREAAANTFSVIAADWVAVESKEAGWTDDYRGEVEASLRNHLGDFDRAPVAALTYPRLAPALSRLRRVSADMHSKVRSRLNAILWFAVEHGFIPANPLPPERRRKASKARKHYPAVVDLPGIGEILRNARAADPCKGIQRAHALCVFTAQRIGEVVGAEWSELDFDAGTWTIPRQRMKRKDEQRGPHEIPLPPALLAQLREWRIADGDKSVYVCPAPRAAQPITREAVEKFYRRTLDLGGKHGPHSWRSTFKTVSEDAGKDSDAIEAQLDHVIGNKVASAYDRAKRLELRRPLMEWYEATLIAARDGATVTPIRTKRA